MGMTGGGDSSDDWHVDGSDDEKYDPSKSGTGLWQPNAEEILSLFDKLEKDKVLELKWVCPGRRPPKSQHEEEDTDNTQDPNADEEPEEEEEEIKPQQPTEFDFDDEEFDTTTKVTPRRTPGSKTPKSQKKVARMDKVLQHIFIERKQIAAEKEKRRLAFNRSPKTSSGPSKMRTMQGSGGIRHGLSPASSPMQARSGMSPGSASQSPVASSTAISSQAKPGLTTTPMRPQSWEEAPVPRPQSSSVATTCAATSSTTDSKSEFGQITNASSNASSSNDVGGTS